MEHHRDRSLFSYENLYFQEHREYLSPENWGKVHLFVVTDSDDFWSLICDLVDDQSVFLRDIHGLLDSLRDSCIYGLVAEDKTNVQFQESNEDIVAKGEEHLLPCFCVVNNVYRDCCELVWVHSSMRNLGLGKKMVKELEIKSTNYIHKNLLHFWKSCKVHFTGTCPEDRDMIFHRSCM